MKLGPGEAPAPATSRAWPPVWRGFCASLLDEPVPAGGSKFTGDEGDAGSKSPVLWEALVAWHEQVCSLLTAL